MHLLFVSSSSSSCLTDYSWTLNNDLDIQIWKRKLDKAPLSPVTYLVVLTKPKQGPMFLRNQTKPSNYKFNQERKMNWGYLSLPERARTISIAELLAQECPSLPKRSSMSALCLRTLESHWFPTTDPTLIPCSSFVKQVNPFFSSLGKKYIHTVIFRPGTTNKLIIVCPVPFS